MRKARLILVIFCPYCFHKWEKFLDGYKMKKLIGCSKCGREYKVKIKKKDITGI